jgi:hypothetical protein
MTNPDLQVRTPAISNGNTNKSLKIQTVSFGAITYFYTSISKTHYIQNKLLGMKIRFSFELFPLYQPKHFLALINI